MTADPAPQDRDSAPAAPNGRGQWRNRAGFILAAAGAAIGLGNIWKFPFITGKNGGGAFVTIYLVCIVLVGLPVMISEIIIGRAAQKSPVKAYEDLSGKKLMWSIVAWMGVAAGFILLSYYSVVAGWAMKYVELAAGNNFVGQDAGAIGGMFGELATNFGRSTFWHTMFMSLTVVIVLAGVHQGIEAGVRVLMPLLFVLLIGLVIYASTQDSFGHAVEFVFWPHTDNLHPGGVLEALGHSFFTLSVGVGGLITYGSYMNRKEDIPVAAAAITGLDTFVSLTACLVMFPFLFAAGQEPSQGPPLIFIATPIALSELPGGQILGVAFFVLLLFAALTSSISLLEVVVSTVIDKFKIRRSSATLIFGLAALLYGLPSAKSDLSIPGLETLGPDFMQQMDFFVSNVFLPLGGMAIAIFAGWILPRSTSYEEFNSATQRDRLYRVWLYLTRYLVPSAIFLIFIYNVLHKLAPQLLPWQEP